MHKPFNYRKSSTKYYDDRRDYDPNKERIKDTTLTLDDRPSTYVSKKSWRIRVAITNYSTGSNIVMLHTISPDWKTRKEITRTLDDHPSIQRIKEVYYESITIQLRKWCVRQVQERRSMAIPQSITRTSHSTNIKSTNGVNPRRWALVSPHDTHQFIHTVTQRITRQR